MESARHSPKPRCITHSQSLNNNGSIDLPINDGHKLGSTLSSLPTYFVSMRKPGPRSTLYRLIEAGQLTRQALLAPLIERGLEAGDDAVVHALTDSPGIVLDSLARAVGVPDAWLTPRLERLQRLGFVEQRAVGPALAPGFRLTTRGTDLGRILAGQWNGLEETLFGDLAKPDRRAFRKTLKRATRRLSA